MNHLDKKISLGDRLEIQETSNPDAGFPSAVGVLNYLDKIISQGGFYGQK